MLGDAGDQRVGVSHVHHHRGKHVAPIHQRFGLRLESRRGAGASGTDPGCSVRGEAKTSDHDLRRLRSGPEFGEFSLEWLLVRRAMMMGNAIFSSNIE